MPKKYGILGLLKQLLQDALEWSQTEIELTRTDAKAVMNNYITALALFFAAFAILIAALFTLAQTVIGAIATYVHGHIIAGFIVSAVLFGLTLLLLAIARYFLTRKSGSKGLIFRRITGVRID
jgi:Putative Actinobacterial Holin-X, holin superfamily III